MSLEIQKLDINPRLVPFAPPPGGRVTIAGLRQRPFYYWKTVRIAMLAGYRIQWVVPGQGGHGSTQTSVLSLVAGVIPAADIKPARTVAFDLEPFVQVLGHAHVEPSLGTRITIRATCSGTTGRAVERGSRAAPAPGALGETARWQPLSVSYAAGSWAPLVAPVAPDAALAWKGALNDLPVINDQFNYGRFGEWTRTNAMHVSATSNLLLSGLGPAPGLTIMVVASVISSGLRWVNLIGSTEPDLSAPDTSSRVALRMMRDGIMHLYSGGWHESLPLAGETHKIVMFGFSLDSDGKGIRMFTTSSTFQMFRSRLMLPHSTTAQWQIGRSGQEAAPIDILDIVLFRSTLTDAKLSWAAAELDAAYGITAGYE